MSPERVVLLLGLALLGACGPDDERPCVAGQCATGVCEPGTVEPCYSGHPDTEGIGACIGGTRMCDPTGNWMACEGEIVPVGERCGDGIDNNCSGTADEDVDADLDGFTTCAGDCCDTLECAQPALVNPGAFDALGNGVDDDCDGATDNTRLLCDQGIPSNTTNALDFARALDICQTATETDQRWGVISAALTLTDGTGTPDPVGHSVRPTFGANLLPQGGVSLVMLSTGAAAARNDRDPDFFTFGGQQHAIGRSAPFPPDFLAAHGGRLPNAPGCPDPVGASATDPEMLTLRVRVPSNARSFKLSSSFYSAEFPEYTCTKSNDFFVVLLDSAYTGLQPNPTDKNLAFFQPEGTEDRVPIGVNLAHGDTGLFTQCKNGMTGCAGSNHGTISTCISTDELVGTGFDDAGGGQCNPGQFLGGGTGWLDISGNVVPGEVITLRIAIWDTGDAILDSLAVVDGFQWSTELSDPGAVIGKYAD